MRKARIIKKMQRVYAWIEETTMTGERRLIRGRRIK